MTRGSKHAAASVSPGRSGISDELLIDLDVVVGHALSGKSLIEHFPASMPVNGPELLHLAHHFIKILADKTRLTMTDDFRDRTRR